MKLTKKSVFVLGLVGSVFVLVLVLLGTTACYRNDICGDLRSFLSDDNLTTTLVFPVVFILSFITYRMKGEVFNAWFKIAVWFVPVIIGVTIWLNSLPSNGGFFNMDNAFNMLVLIILYSIFILISVWQIVRTYLKTKHL